MHKIRHGLLKNDSNETIGELQRAIEVIGEIRNVYKSSLYNAIRRLEHEEDGLDKLRNDIKRVCLTPG